MEVDPNLCIVKYFQQRCYCFKNARNAVNPSDLVSKMATRLPYLSFDPYDINNTVLAYISKIVQDRGLVTIIHIYRESYMKFHLASGVDFVVAHY